METARTASASATEEEARTFRQHRVALFGLMGALIGLVGLVMRPVIVLVSGQLQLLFHPAMFYQAVAFGSLLIAGLLLRGRRRSRRFINAVEYAALLGCCIGFVGIGATIPLEVTPEILMPFGLGLILFLRAVYVPSTRRRTLTIALLMAPLIVGTSYYIYITRRPPTVDIDLGSPENQAFIRASMSAVWWTLITIVSAATSHVIYGLRQEIRDIRKLGQYTLERKLGEGGMGAVYKAHHAMLRRPAAVKLLPPHKIGEESLARFEREVQLTALLTHANTITVFDYGRTPEGVFYYVMELIDGVTLSAVIAIDGAQPPGRVVHILAQVAGALTEAHAIGLIHRDIKPGNIMLCRRGGEPDVVKVVDFGLVKEVSPDVASSLTNADVLTGTPQYMAPEAIRAPTEVGPATDIYALGAVGYFLLTGEHLFTGNAVEVCSHHLHTPPTPPSERLERPVPDDLEALIMACLAKDPTDRPSSAEQLQRALRQVDPGDWSPDDAKLWWREHQGEVVSRTSDERSGPATIAVDLGTRSTRPSGRLH